MIGFLFKGIVRDRGRSLFPFLTVLIGVFLTVVLFCYMKGATSAVTRTNANFQTGHVKVMTRAYARESDQAPNDAGLTDVTRLLQDLGQRFPAYEWAARIRVGGLLDIPDDKGETRTQGPAFGIAADILTPGSREPGRLGLAKGIKRGRLPARAGEILVSDDFARKLGVGPGDTATLISTTAHGSMAMANFTISGTIRFGAIALDRMGFIIDLADARAALDMDNGAGEILGLFVSGVFDRRASDETARLFNEATGGIDKNDFAPTMVPLAGQSNLGQLLDLWGASQTIIILIFLLPMSLVLWNAGLLGSLRRYGEMGVRLAIGEDKGHVYRTLLAESLMIGMLGSVAGTILGLAVSYYLQAHGFDVTSLMKNASMLMPSVLYAQVTPFSYAIGFFPGLVATSIGTAIAGRGIYKRQTARLFKELET